MLLKLIQVSKSVKSLSFFDKNVTKFWEVEIK